MNCISVKPLCFTPLFTTLQCLSISLRVKATVLTVTSHSLNIQAPETSLSTSPTPLLPDVHSTPATLVSLFPQHTRHSPASGFDVCRTPSGTLHLCSHVTFLVRSSKHSFKNCNPFILMSSTSTLYPTSPLQNLPPLLFT